MNENKIVWLQTGAAGRPAGPRANPNSWLRISKNKAGNGRMALSIVFYTPLMRAAGLRAGERIVVGFDDSYMYIRQAANGWLLSPYPARNYDKASLHGKRVTSVMKMPDNPYVPTGVFGKDALIVDDDGTIVLEKHPLGL